jgi:hypothetical protein
MSVRPHFRMIAHSAFIIVSRKLVAASSNPHEHQQEPIPAADSGEGESDGVDADEPLD